MNIVKDKIVTFGFILRDEAGHILDTSGEKPVTYLHGYNHIMPLLEQAQSGKTVGDKINVSIPMEKAYGQRDERLIRMLDRQNFAKNDQLRVGMNIVSSEDKDKRVVMKIIKIEGDNITIDANHPLAGINLQFEMNILDIRDATADEIANRIPDFY